MYCNLNIPIRQYRENNRIFQKVEDAVIYFAQKELVYLCVLHRRTNVHVAIYTILQSDENKH